MAPAMAPVLTMTAPPHTPSHKRSATSIFKSIVSPHKSSHKKAASQSLGPANPLNTYMVANSRIPPQLPPLDSLTFLPPLDPPQAPFAQQARHKRSLSSLSISSFTSKKEVPRSPTRSIRNSMDIKGTMFDILLGDQNSVKAEKKPSKTRSTIDFSILRQKGHKGKKSMHDLKTLFRDKENQRPAPDVNINSSAGSVELNSTSGGSTGLPGLPLFTLPRNHPHAQGTRSGNSKTNTPRITPQSSNHSLQRSLLPALPVAAVLQPTGSFASSNLSSSIKRVGTEPRVNTEELVRKYTPAEYTPSSQRNFFKQHEQPMLIPKPGSSSSSKQRPKSSYIPHSASGASTGLSVASPRRTSYELRQSWEKRRSEVSNDGSTDKGSPATSEGSGKSNRSGGAGLDLAGIDIAFEALLVCNTRVTIYHSI